MPLDKQKQISAEVALKSASGKTFDGSTAITAENVAEYQPSAEAAADARKDFAEAGFETSPVGGLSFSVTAPVKTFESFFKVKLEEDGKGGITIKGKSGSGAYELPMKALPKKLAQAVVAVTFSPPPDYGPGNF